MAPKRPAETPAQKSNRLGRRKRPLEETQANDGARPLKKPAGLSLKSSVQLQSQADATTANKTATVDKPTAEVPIMEDVAKQQKNSDKTVVDDPAPETASADESTIEKKPKAEATNVKEAETKKKPISGVPSIDQTARRLGELRLNDQLLVPEAVKEIIRTAQVGEYEIVVPIKTLSFFHRLAWGVKSSATDIIVNLVLLKGKEGARHYGFCVHLDPDDLADKYHHNFTTTDMPWRDMIVCNKAANFLTDALSRELHAFLRQQKEEDDDELLGSILEKIKEVASSDPTQGCIICGTKFATTVWRPLPCSKAACRERLSAWSLETRLSPFLRTPKVLDLLLACMSAYRVSVTLDAYFPVVLVPGLTSADLHKTLNAFPQITDETTLSDLMLTGGQRVAKEKLLSWLCTEFEGTIVPAPPSTQVASLGSEQFLVLNGPVKREAEVDLSLKTSKVARNGKSTGGVAAFHGTPQMNLFSILHNGLLNTRRQVWYSSEPKYSLDFTRKDRGTGRLTGPVQSTFKTKTVLFGVEAVHQSSNLETVNADDQAKVAIRYAFVLPNADNPPAGLTSRPVMDRTIEKIRSGKILEEL